MQIIQMTKVGVTAGLYDVCSQNSPGMAAVLRDKETVQQVWFSALKENCMGRHILLDTVSAEESTDMFHLLRHVGNMVS